MQTNSDNTSLLLRLVHGCTHLAGEPLHFAGVDTLVLRRARKRRTSSGKTCPCFADRIALVHCFECRTSVRCSSHLNTSPFFRVILLAGPIALSLSLIHI